MRLKFIKIILGSALVFMSSCAAPSALQGNVIQDGNSFYLRRGSNYLAVFQPQLKGRSFREFPATISSSRISDDRHFVSPVKRLPNDLVVRLRSVKSYTQGGHVWYYAVFQTADPRLANVIAFEVNLGLDPTVDESYRFELLD